MREVYVPSGPFEMGSNSGEAEEKPVHKVTLSAYWIDRTEVTIAMFARFVADAGYKTDAEKDGSSAVFNPQSKQWERTTGANWQHPQGPNSSLSGLDQHPVVHVSWNDAAAYCAWVGARLPTEAEWEKAARGTDGRAYPWGNAAPDGKLVNFADENLAVDGADKSANDGFQFTAPVGSYPAGASPYGALDMAGNVWEWVNDWYGETYFQGSPTDNPQGPATGDYRVLRGGSWNYDGSGMRASLRGRSSPVNRNVSGGFRCAR
jgi:formylglycine-generating enzyme required for sulfatase activity